MKQFNVLDIGEVYSNPDCIYKYAAWPTVEKGDSGEILVTFSGGRLKHCDPFGKVLLLKSKNQGKTWSAPVTVIDTPLDDRDSGILNMGDGNLMVTTFNNTKKEQLHWVST